MTITKTESWTRLPGQALVGILILRNAPNQQSHPDLDHARAELENDLRDKYGSLDRKAIREDPIWGAYDAFYRSFRKTYHVQLQLESVVFKGKGILSPSALVTCMFMAELKTGLLTAAHDLSAVELPLVAEIAAGIESYQRLDGGEQGLKTGDLFIRDRQGILSSVIYGPDRRTQIRPQTTEALFTTYGPPGITLDQIQAELEILEGYIRLFAPQAVREELSVI